MECVNLRGVTCPTNYVRVRLALEPLAAGDEIEVLLDAGEPTRNVPRSLRDDGDEIIALAWQGDHFVMRVRKGGGGGDW